MKKPSGKESASSAAKAPRAAKPAEVEEARVLRKKDLVLRAAEASGVKRKDTRAVVEAVLAEIGAALSRGEGLVLPPLGKAKVNRQKEKGSAEVLVVRLRRGGKPEAAGGAEEALAKAGD